MPERSGARGTGKPFRLAATALIGLWAAKAAFAQVTVNPLSAQVARPAIPAEPKAASKVFPEGGFPDLPRTPEGGIPARTPVPDPGLLDPALHAPDSDYGVPGYETRGMQEGPGMPEFYRPISAPLPAYYYDPSYYETPVIGPHSVSDYAPPGYEARDVDEGQAPGVPEFTLITPPLPVTPEERERFVTRGIFPGSFLVPGTNTSFRLRGFVRLTGLYDFNPIGSRDDFVTNTIPVPQQVGQNVNFAARYSRIAFETWTPTPFKEWNVHTFLEGDFFNGPAQAVGGGGNPFRLRHAFVDFGYFRIGQQNTVFMDGNAFPNTVDFAGPRGLINQRQPSVRMTLPLCDQWFWAVGMDRPFSDITTNGLGTNVQDVPDFSTHIRYEGDLGHVQLSTIVRSIGYRPTFGEVTRRTGWGCSASTVFHPWAWLMGSNPVRKANPTGLERCRILLMYNFGWGIGRYVQDTAGLGLDGQVDPKTGAFDTLYAAGWSASYEHWFNERWLANVTYSPTLVASAPGQPGSTYVGAKYLATSLWFIPITRMSLGVEYVWGERDDLSEQSARSRRLNALLQYNF
jgi:hypothetical protein